SLVAGNAMYGLLPWFTLQRIALFLALGDIDLWPSYYPIALGKLWAKFLPPVIPNRQLSTLQVARQYWELR
ncbi:hypothetical protein QUB29_26500, partial [Microcoleus sp. B4b_D2]|uniref:hypothetical protein n=1 Tax=Microcoleus sp. B4b_D2 TaxID=3055310 RepID=UPI002FD2B3D6